ncbi:MAG: amino terminal protease self-immunity [Bacteroidetes bacterium]|nr:amino terminal protease self-immunity [Bacteroidota bacterium]
MKKLIIPVLIAAFLWFLMFSPWTSHYFNFWIAMAISASILMIMSFVLSKDLKSQFRFSPKDVALGLGSAVVLWCVFYFGDFFSKLIFDFARPQVDSIYAMKEGQNKLLLVLGLLFIIGPAEEIFWRGYVQHSLIGKFGEWKAMIITTMIYALVHIWSFNFMLVMAALICGLFWGLMYKYNKNLVPLIVSHAVWDVMVFIVVPIM